jgi:hypothetical protein
MTEAVFQFKAINRRLNRQEQKAEFEEKNPSSELPSAYAKACSAAVPLTSMAHPAWPYAGTPFEWTKFVKVKF